MRIAVGGIHTESSTWSPVFTRLEDFRVLRGDALVADEYFSFLKLFDHEFLPLLHARAIPGGRVEAAAYASLKEEFLGRLSAALPVDGVYLAMHGAMYVDGREDAEGDWITAVRDIVGPDVPMSVSYDLHGNVSERIIDAIDMFAAYRTAPHIDVRETMLRAVRMLDRCLTTGVTPHVAFVKVPVLLPGERTATTDAPLDALYASLPSYDTVPGVWDANLMIGYVWADEPRATACAVVTGTDTRLMAETADEIAGRYFALREACVVPGPTGTIEACLDMIEATGTSPAILADSGDNPTGGGVGDRPDVLAALLRRGIRGALVAGIADPQATAAAFRSGVGATLSLLLGASLDRVSARPLPVTARVVRLDPGQDGTDRRAVLEIAGNHVVVTKRRRPFHNLSDFRSLGFEPAEQSLIVVKSGYLSPDLAPIARPVVMALSPGVVDQDIAHLPVRHIRRPTYPFDRIVRPPGPAHVSARARRSR